MWKANTVPFFAGKVGVFSSTSIRDSNVIPEKKKITMNKIKEEPISKVNSTTIMEPNLSDYQKIMVVGQGKVDFIIYIYSN